MDSILYGSHVQTHNELVFAFMPVALVGLLIAAVVIIAIYTSRCNGTIKTIDAILENATNKLHDMNYIVETVCERYEEYSNQNVVPPVMASLVDEYDCRNFVDKFLGGLPADFKNKESIKENIRALYDAVDSYSTLINQFNETFIGLIKSNSSPIKKISLSLLKSQVMYLWSVYKVTQDKPDVRKTMSA